MALVHKMDRIAMAGNRHRLEPLAGARAADAIAVDDAEQRAVGRAQDESPGDVEEPVAPPVERVPGVREGIHIGDDGVAAAHEKDAAARNVAAEPEALAAAVLDFFAATQEAAGRGPDARR